MRVLTLVSLLSAASLVLAQGLPGPSIREVALNLAVTMTRNEMSACAKAHPAHTERFMASVTNTQKKVEAALDGLRPQRTEELDLVVPEIVVVGQEMMFALQASDTSIRSMESCNRKAVEIANGSDREVSELMSQIVTTLVSGVAVHKQGMQRVLP